MDDPTKTQTGRTYQAEVITGAEESVAGRLRLSEAEALSLIDKKITVLDPSGREISATVVGDTPEALFIERLPDGQVLVKFVGHYLSREGI